MDCFFCDFALCSFNPLINKFNQWANGSLQKYGFKRLNFFETLKT